MAKSIAKEIFIIFLLSVAILLILLVLFYDYIPNNKVIPEQEAYVTPNGVKEEIEEDIVENNTVPITYSITDADLNIYKQTGTTIEGKSNPFALEETTQTNTSNGNNNNDNNGNNNGNDNQLTNENTDNNTNIDKNSTGTFFNDEGIK